MRVLLIRHAPAQDQAEFAKTGQPDEERPLTGAGKKSMRSASRGLARAVRRIDVLATSPLVRAEQTADIVADDLSPENRETIDALKPDSPYNEFVEWLSGKRNEMLVAAVGHNPHLSGLAASLIGAAEATIDMKKGSALLIEFAGEPRLGQGRLLWYLKPGQLRKLK